jgi:ABC-type hemin transport system ATPase subunit
MNAAASLDLGQQARLISVLSSLARDECTILTSLYQPNQAPRWCGRAVLLHEGMVCADGASRDVITAITLSSGIRCLGPVGGGRRSFIRGSGGRVGLGFVALPEALQSPVIDRIKDQYL